MNQYSIQIAEAVSSAVVFIVLWRFLATALFKPFLANYQEREARTVGDEHSASEMKNKTKQLSRRIEEELNGARLEGISLRDEQINAAKVQAQELLDRASAAAQEEIKRASLKVQEMKKRAESELPQEVERLAQLVITKALSTSPGGTVH